MLIDFDAVYRNKISLYQLANRFGINELRSYLAGYVEASTTIILGVKQSLLFVIPHDPLANDANAEKEEDRHAGWSMAHQVLHATATAEEGAAVSSILARGIPEIDRVRYEGDWHKVTKLDQVTTRLTECQRICLAYLDTWPDKPHLETLRIYPDSPNPVMVNAPTAFVNGLMHWHGHITQLTQVARQLSTQH